MPNLQSLGVQLMLLASLGGNEQGRTSLSPPLHWCSFFWIRTITWCICWELRLDQETYHNRVNREMTRCDVQQHTWWGAGLAWAPAPDPMRARYWGLAGRVRIRCWADSAHYLSSNYTLSSPPIQPEVCATKHAKLFYTRLVYHVVFLSLLMFNKKPEPKTTQHPVWLYPTNLKTRTSRDMDNSEDVCRHVDIVLCLLWISQWPYLATWLYLAVPSSTWLYLGLFQITIEWFWTLKPKNGWIDLWMLVCHWMSPTLLC